MNASISLHRGNEGFFLIEAKTGNIHKGFFSGIAKV